MQILPLMSILVSNQ